MANLADTLGSKPAELEALQLGAYPGFGCKFKGVPGVFPAEEVIKYLLSKSPSMGQGSDLIPWTAITNADRDPEAVTAGVTISDLRWRLSNDRLLHVCGRISTPGGGLSAATILQLVPTDYFTEKGVETNLNAGLFGLANVIYFKDTTSTFKGTLNVTGQMVVDINASGFLDFNGYMHIDNNVPA